MTETSPRKNAFLTLERRCKALEAQIQAPDREYLTYLEIQHRFGFSRSWLRDRIADGSIVAVKLSPRTIRISAASVQALLDNAPPSVTRPSHRRSSVAQS